MSETESNAIRSIINIISEDSVLKTVLSGSREGNSDENNKAYLTIEDFIKDASDSGFTEAKVKKVIEIAILIAKKRGVLPAEFNDMSPEMVAALADEVVTSVNVACQVATGKIDATDASDILIDRATSRISAMVDYAFESGLFKKGVNALTTAVCKYCKIPPEPILIIENQLIDKFHPAIKKTVQKGVQILNKYAKVAAKKMIEQGRKTLSDLKTFLFS